jgi:hypothetical protein
MPWFPQELEEMSLTDALTGQLRALAPTAISVVLGVPLDDCSPALSLLQPDQYLALLRQARLATHSQQHAQSVRSRARTVCAQGFKYDSLVIRCSCESVCGLTV